MDTAGLICPVERWPGKAYLKSPIPLIDIDALEEAIEQIGDIDEEKRTARRRAITNLLLPAVLGCYDHFELEGLDERMTVFPGAPKVDSDLLAGWLINEVMKAYRGDVHEIPLANSEQP